MKEIFIITDYKKQFGSKTNSNVYRGGMDIKTLVNEFAILGLKSNVLSFSEVDFRTSSWEKRIVVYTSQEDQGYYYKDYIEDIVYALELAGAIVIPNFKYLRANNNKVFMEILRDLTQDNSLGNIKSNHFATIKELKDFADKKQPEYPVVVKSAAGATSEGVYIGKNDTELFKIGKKASKIPWHKDQLKDYIRPYKYKGYIKNSSYRNKYIIQNFIKGLQNDWKLLIFENRYYIEYRGIRDNDFRASGSHRFKLNEDIPVDIPEAIFDFAEKVKNILDVPHLSIDIGFANGTFYLFEFQALYFSSYAQYMSDSYYIRKDGIFEKVEEKLPLEKVYAEAVANYLNKKQ